MVYHDFKTALATLATIASMLFALKIYFRFGIASSTQYFDVGNTIIIFHKKPPH